MIARSGDFTQARCHLICKVKQCKSDDTLDSRCSPRGDCAATHSGSGEPNCGPVLPAKPLEAKARTVMPLAKEIING